MGTATGDVVGDLPVDDLAVSQGRPRVVEDGVEDIGGGVTKDGIGDSGGVNGFESKPVSVPDIEDGGALEAAVLVSVSESGLVLVLMSARCACLVVVVLALCEVVVGGGTAMIVRGRCQWDADYYEAAVSRRSCWIVLAGYDKLSRRSLSTWTLR